MAVYEVAFDVEIDWHEYIEAEDEFDAKDLAEDALSEKKFYDYIIEKLKRELEMASIDAHCECESRTAPTINKHGLL